MSFYSIGLSWSAPSHIGFCYPVNYIITVTPLDDSDPWTITTTDNSTSYIVTGLVSGHSYNFTIRANHSIGFGEESNIITVTLPGEGIQINVKLDFSILYLLVPPSVILNVCLKYSNDNTELVISWTVS